VSERRCGLAGCRRIHFARGLCQSHYGRWRKYGEAMSVAPVGTLPHGPTPPPLPISHDCPRCEDGGLVVPYRALDPEGLNVERRCVVRGCWSVVAEVASSPSPASPTRGAEGLDGAAAALVHDATGASRPAAAHSQ